MIIEKVEIENFRSIRSAVIDFNPVTSFLGRNGVGKSTVLYALDSFYNISAQYSEHDYFNHDQQGSEIRICVTYGSLSDAEVDEFGGYVQDRKLIVTKRINSGGANYYGSTPQIPEFSELRNLRATERRAGIVALKQRDEFDDLPDIPRRDADVEQVMIDYERAHPERTVPIERLTQFFGPRNVGGGKLDKFTKFVLIPAVRDIATEMQKRGAIMQLIDLLVTRSISTRQDFVEFKEQFEARAKELYGLENLPELQNLGRLITERLKRYAPGAELMIDFAELATPQIPLPEAVVLVSEDNFPVPPSYTGHGLQRALILALLEELSLTPIPQVSEEEVPDNEEAGPDQANEVHLPDLILAIEEPELYLHPGRSRFLSRILHQLTEANHERPLTQVCYVTHSPYFVDVSKFDEVRICRKEPEGEGIARSTKFFAFTKAQATIELERIWKKPPGTFTPESFVARSAPVLNSIVNEGLFADYAIVVEGESDIAALWAVQKHFNYDWDEKGVVIVPAGGKNNIDRVVVSLSGFQIPTYFVFDGDKDKPGANAATNRTYLHMGEANIEDFPDTGIFEKCAVFKVDLEEELKSATNDRFEEIRDGCANELGLDRPSKCLKNPQATELFIAQSYERGFSFPSLEQIVNTVNSYFED